MREHETNFLRHLLLACGTTESRKLDDILCQAQINERCVRRTIWWTLQLILLALAGLGYTTVLLRDIPDPQFELLMRLFSRLGFGSSLALAGFGAYWVISRTKLNLRRNECRNFVLRVLQSCWERSNTIAFPPEALKELDYPAELIPLMVRRQVNQ